MLQWAAVFLIGAVIAVLYIVKGKDTTHILIAKILFYTALSLSFVLFSAHIIDTAPPIFNESSKLPL